MDTAVTSAAPSAGERDPWSPALRIAFRAVFVYFALYVITTQMLNGLIPGVSFGDIGSTGPIRGLFLWIGTYILGVANISTAVTGSGDKMFDWVQSFSLLLIAVCATLVWSLAQPSKPAHQKLYTYFRLVMRFALGTTLIGYGMAKAIPLQMPVLALTRLVEPFGNFSPMGVLWYSVGASPAYEIVTGCAEVVAGLLLFWPRTATLGALVSLMDMTMVFILNMTYDVPVKLFSFHLVLLSLVLLAPNLRHLFELFFLHRTSRVAEEPALSGNMRVNKGLVRAQVIFGFAALAAQMFSGMDAWKTYGGDAPRSALFGIWDVTAMTIDGEAHPALLTDMMRIRRMIFQQPTSATVQHMDDVMKSYMAEVDSVKKTLVLTGNDSAKTKSSLTYSHTSAKQLAIDGTMNGHTVHMDLAARDLNSFLLRSRGFHWVQEAPFNR